MTKNTLQEVIANMQRYQKEVLEVPQPAFQGKAVCPFAKKEREDDKVEYRLCEIVPGAPSQALVDMMKGFITQQKYSTLLAIDPVTKVTTEELTELGERLCELCRAERMIAIGLHPDDPFTIAGFRTRSIPYVTLVGQQADYLKWAKDKLQSSSYYKNWTAAALEYNYQQIGRFL